MKAKGGGVTLGEGELRETKKREEGREGRGEIGEEEEEEDRETNRARNERDRKDIGQKRRHSKPRRTSLQNLLHTPNLDHNPHYHPNLPQLSYSASLSYPTADLSYR